MAFSPETYALIMGKGGAANGFATLNGSGKIPESQLPSYVDDVVEGYYYNDKFYADAQHTEEITAATGKIYIDLSTGYSYRWGGSEYVNVNAAYAPLASPALTGTPTAPTAESGTNTTQIATTAFVQTAVSGAITDAIGGSY